MEYQRTADRIINWLVLRAIPRWVHPNHLAGLRLALVPVVAVLYIGGLRWWAVAAFVFAAFLDLFDGALARTRNQCTRLGLFLDPLADKLLIGTLLAVVGWEYLVVKVLLVLVAAELIALVVATVADRTTGMLLPSNIMGKAKMWLQSVGVGLLVIARLVESRGVAQVATGILWAALGFGVLAALISLGMVVRTRSGQGRTGDPLD